MVQLKNRMNSAQFHTIKEYKTILHFSSPSNTELLHTMFKIRRSKG